MEYYHRTFSSPYVTTFSSIGCIYSISIKGIENYFYSAEKNLEDECRRYQALLSRLNELLAYRDLAEFPDDLLALAKEKYPEASAKKIRSIVSGDMKKKLAKLKKESDSWRYYNSSFEFLDSETYCLNWFNRSISEQEFRKASLQDLRRWFARYEREYLVDHFISRVAELRVSSFEPCVERMICSANARYQNTIDLIQRKRLERMAKDSSSQTENIGLTSQGFKEIAKRKITAIFNFRSFHKAK